MEAPQSDDLLMQSKELLMPSIGTLDEDEESRTAHCNGTQDVHVMGDAVMGGIEFSGHQHLNNDPSVECLQPEDGMRISTTTGVHGDLVWMEPSQSSSAAPSAYALEDSTPEHGNRKLDMSLDELIAQNNSYHPQAQDLQYSNKNQHHRFDDYSHRQPYHHQYKGRRGPSGSGGMLHTPMGGNPTRQHGTLHHQHHRNSPFPIPVLQQPPPPPPSVPSFSPSTPTSQLVVNPHHGKEFPSSMTSLSFNQVPLGHLSSLMYGPQRSHNHRRMVEEWMVSQSPEQQQQQLQALRKTRLYRSEPYDLHHQGSIRRLPIDSLQLRNQLIVELLRQERRSLLMSTSEQHLQHPGLQGLLLAGQPDGPSRGPPRKVLQQQRQQDSIALAEQSALNDSELIYPVMVEEEGGGPVNESNDDALIIRFKGTDLLKVRKARGDLVLNSGGWRTLSTRLVLNKALSPLGIRIEEVPSDSLVASPASEPLATAAATAKRQLLLSTTLSSAGHEWRVVDLNHQVFLATFIDGMVIGSVGASSRKQLMARASVIAQNWKQVKSSLARKKV